MIGYFIFNFIFDHQILKQIESWSILFEEVMRWLKLNEVIGAETILNLSYLVSHKYKGISFDKFIPTILMKFF